MEEVKKDLPLVDENSLPKRAKPKRAKKDKNTAEKLSRDLKEKSPRNLPLKPREDGINLEAVERQCHHFAKLTDREKREFFRKSGMLVLHTFSKKGRLSLVPAERHLQPVVHHLSSTLMTIERFKKLVLDGYAQPTPEAYEALQELRVKGFDEVGRPQELALWEPVLAAITAIGERYSGLVENLYKTLPERGPRKPLGNEPSQPEKKAEETTTEETGSEAQEAA